MSIQWNMLKILVVLLSVEVVLSGTLNPTHSVTLEIVSLLWLVF